MRVNSWRLVTIVAVSAACLGGLLVACQTRLTKNGSHDDRIAAMSIAELRAELDAGRTTSAELVRIFRTRIERIDRSGPTLHSIIALNPNADDSARNLDRELQQKGARSLLHGIPVLLKDNIETKDPMPTTAGSLALIDNYARADAPIVARLREAGAVILGKTNLSEWANFRSRRSISGWSAVGGLVKNPHVLDRSACGSSAGTGAAVAAMLAPGGFGTETDGSVTCPSSMNGLVGLKPTLGLLSQQGIVPIAHSQDTAGPMARTVSDVAILLTYSSTQPCKDNAHCAAMDYSKDLSPQSLRGKRVGVWRFAKGRLPAIDDSYDHALQVLRDCGATLVEVEVPDTTAIGAAEFTVLLYEFKADLNAYLARTPTSVKVRSLEQLIAFNKESPRELRLFGQDTAEAANLTGALTDARYVDAHDKSKQLAGIEGIAKVIHSNQLDLIVAPTTGPAWRIDLVNGDRFPGSFSTLPAVSGYPHLTVPMGAVQGLPVGLSFIGLPNSEASLLAAGYAFEQKAQIKLRPMFKPSIDTGTDAAAK